MSDKNPPTDKPKNRFELHSERLATTDEHGNRIYLYPEDVKGFWKKHRDRFFLFLIVLYMTLPWIYIKNKPLLMLDIRSREFTFFGNTFHGMEPLIIFFALVAGLFFIGFVTSLFGRLWCGWACPQTVFIQTLFQGIEKLIEGSARKRKELDDGPLSFDKLWKKTLKWILFTALSLHIVHTFVGYFVGPRELFHMSMLNPTENWGVFIAVMIGTAIILFDFGWFREQFCIIMCPYGRIQSVMMDENSMVVAYDQKRGEPRRGTVPRENEGDCINCYNCVKVCPTGIDIRRGAQQLECIACTNCIDACDEIMEKIQKPKGLIRYSTENLLQGKPQKNVTVRSVIYVSFSLLFTFLFFFMIFKSTNLSVQFIRHVATPYTMTTEKDGSKKILNMYNLKLVHQGDHVYYLTYKTNVDGVEFITPRIPTKVDKPEMKIPFFFKFPESILSNGSRIVTLEIYDGEDPTQVKLIEKKEFTLVGPIVQ